MGNPNGHVIHGMSHHPLYPVWITMRQRCRDPNCRGYRWYGAKGVRVCPEWDSFPNFVRWAEQSGYRPGLTIDRINSSGNYSPDNCRWVTIQDQQRNRTSNHRLTFNGESKSIQEWSELTGISRTTINGRLRLGWNIEDVLTTPVHGRSSV